MKKFRLFSVTAASVIAAASVQTFPSDAFSVGASEKQYVYINEVCSQNKTGITDSYGKHSDWIELWNKGNTAADISGYYLSDDPENPFKWSFPDGTIIEAGGYLVVFASEKESVGDELHTGFSLSKNGEGLRLSTSDKEIYNSFGFPSLGEDVSFGPSPDGSYSGKMTPTPGKANETRVSEPYISQKSGFYDSSFDLAIDVPKGTSVYYTTDGSNPKTSKTAKFYDNYSGTAMIENRSNAENIYSNYEEGEGNQNICRGLGYRKPTFKVDKATVVRAVAKNSAGEYSEIIERTYFIGSSGMLNYKNLTVVSLVTDPDNLFDPDKGIYVNGNQFVQWRNSGAYQSDKSVWDTDNVTNYFSKGSQWEREATISVFENGSLSFEQGVGIRIKGASTRNTAQKSFNIFARSNYGETKIKTGLLSDNYSFAGELIEKYDSLSVRSASDPSRLNDGFAQGLLYGRENLTTQNMKSCVLFLDGEFWGMYQITEKLSDYFIESTYDIPKQDVAMIKNNEPEEGGQAQCDEFLDFAEKYSQMDMTNASNYKAVCEYIDVDSFIEMYAAGIYLGTWDWPNRNYGAWRNTGDVIEGNQFSDGKWRFITFDLDYTMGDTYATFGGVEGFAYDNFRHMDSAKKDAPTSLFVNLLKNNEFRAKFVSVYCDYINSVMTTDKVNKRIEEFSREYTDMIAASVTRWWGFNGGSQDSLMSYNRGEYQKRLNTIKTFFEQRPDNTLRHMKNYLGLSGEMQTITVDVKGKGKVRISSLYADGSGKWSGKYLSDSPVTLTAIPEDGQKFTGWSGDASGSELTITVTLSQAMSITASFDASGTGDSVRKGDINADGKVNSLDVVKMQKILFGLTDGDSSADMNSDDKINIADLCLLKQTVLG